MDGLRSARRPRTPGAVYAGVVLVLLVVIGAIAMTQRQPPPPAIAEFAPQAVEKIRESPDDQSSSSGRDGGAAGSGGGAGAVSPEPTPVVEVPRVRRCVGDPPRQIEDPQAPPCVPYWAGDNGGATSKGVTRDEVRVAVPMLVYNRPVDGTRDEVVDGLERFFNARFETYGRRITFQRFDSGNNESEKQQAHAVATDEERKAFASTPYYYAGGYFYHRELARRRVISTMGVETILEQRELASVRPYLWNYVMPSEGMLANLGEWMCNRLAGRPVTHSGAGISGQRRFGLVLRPYHDDIHYSMDPLTDGLRTCNESFAADVRYPPSQFQSGGGSSSEEQDAALTNTLLRLQDAKVTSVLCNCQYIYLQALSDRAIQQGYFPEWLLSSWSAFDNEMPFNGLKGPQADHAFGITFQPRQNALTDDPYWWAVQEGHPGTADPTQFNGYWEHQLYRSLLLIVSGIQMAGPNLTPATFESGLRRARFPNPDVPSVMAGHVGFQGGAFGMTLDAAEYWRSSTARGVYSGQSGAICYVDGGARHALGSWPGDGDPFFTGTCDAT